MFFPYFSSLFPFVLPFVSLVKGVIQCLRRMFCLSVGLRTTYAATILTNAGVGVWDGLTQQLRDLNCPKCDFPAKNCFRSRLGHVDRSALLAPVSHLTQLLLDTCFGPCSPASLLQKNKPREPFWCLSGSCGLVFVRRDAGEKTALHVHLEKQARNRMRREGHKSQILVLFIDMINHCWQHSKGLESRDLLTCSDF